MLYEKSYDRYYISGTAENVKQSFNGEVYVDKGVVMGFDAKIADGKYSSKQEPVFLLISEIGTIEEISIPSNAKEFDPSELTETPEPVPVDPSKIPPISDTPKDR
ncbi:MAG: hypothetical protein R2883_02735 [Caldisericia bacterium]